MSLEDELEKKYETEFSQYCFDVLGITNGEGYLRRLENGEFWDWLGEYHPEEMQTLIDEDNRRMQERVRTDEEEKELDEIDRQMIRGSGIVYDPPMTNTEQYLLDKEREEEYKSYDY